MILLEVNWLYSAFTYSTCSYLKYDTCEVNYVFLVYLLLGTKHIKLSSLSEDLSNSNNWPIFSSLFRHFKHHNIWTAGKLDLQVLLFHIKFHGDK